MSIHLVLQAITVDQYERLVAGDGAEMLSWVREEHDLDKTWQVLHPLLVNGRPDDAPRAAKAITGEVVIASPYVSYEPPFGEVRREVVLPDGSREEMSVSGLAAVSAGLVPLLAADLAAITDEDFNERAARIPVPPVYSHPLPAEEVPDYLWALRQLQDIYESAAAQGKAIAVWCD